MQLTTEYAGGSFRAQSIFRKDWSTGKSKLVVFLEVLPQVLLCFTELGTVALIEDEYNLLLINRQITLAFHEVVQLLNGSDDNLVIIFIDVSLQACCTFRAVDAVG